MLYEATYSTQSLIQNNNNNNSRGLVLMPNEVVEILWVCMMHSPFCPGLLGCGRWRQVRIFSHTLFVSALQR